MAKRIGYSLTLALLCLMLLYVAVTCEITDVYSPDERITVRTEFETYPVGTTQVTVFIENNYDVDIWLSTWVLEKWDGDTWDYITNEGPSFGYMIAGVGEVLTPPFPFFDPDSFFQDTSSYDMSGP